MFSSYSLLSSADSSSIEILSAVVKDQKVGDAEALFQRNGKQSAIIRSNAQGMVRAPSDYPDDNNTLLIVRKSGYSNLVVKCPCRGMSYAISPVMQNLDGLRVVLSWGAQPYDLDSHMAFAGNHIYFRQKIGTDANLDVDDIDGYGPETITLTRKHFGEPYVYSVHNYSEQTYPRSKTLSNSQAKVFVYVGQSLVRTYYIPRNQPGNLWTVFRLTGNGEFEDINEISGVSGDLKRATALYLNDSPTKAITQIDASTATEAKRLNQLGEKAYHAGELDKAIDFFRNAIEADPAYGQAFSNLGLAYQKANRTAESIWANRKAIALASGTTAPTVRASSYYNIGRIYEAAGQNADALRSYQSAKAQKANPVYDKAIQRVSNK
ncbi:tetratricopeptide repeat protein [Metapseudomonas resinovorans]|uniref:tetratricopeptide repeat protein n=1 Tax=Metapseudomonas resinovorans TaxID=53412 RepID=UPI003B429467